MEMEILTAEICLYKGAYTCSIPQLAIFCPLLVPYGEHSSRRHSLQEVSTTHVLGSFCSRTESGLCEAILGQ